MKIYIHILAECTPLLLFFNQKDENFTITSNDTNSYNLGFVNVYFARIFRAKTEN